MSGLTVGWKSQNRIRSDLENDLCDLLSGDIDVNLSATAIGISQPSVLLDTEDAKARCQLSLADRWKLLRRPPHRIGYAKLAARGRHANHSGTRGRSHCHDAATQIGLIVGMRPDRQDCSQLPDVAHDHESSLLPS